jgi:hypothetical protein
MAQTQNGGAYGYGAVFKLDQTGETLPYSFTGRTDGSNPYGRASSGTRRATSMARLRMAEVYIATEPLSSSILPVH